MIASVSVVLGISDIVLDSQDPHIILADQHLGYLIDVIYKRADDTDPCNVIQVVHHGFHGDFQIPSFQLIHNAHGLLYPGLDHLDGIALIADGKLVIEHFQLGLYLSDGTGIHHHGFLKLVGLGQKIAGHLDHMGHADNRLYQFAVGVHINSHDNTSVLHRVAGAAGKAA